MWIEDSLTPAETETYFFVSDIQEKAMTGSSESGLSRDDI